MAPEHDPSAPADPAEEGEILRTIGELASGRYEVLGLLGRTATGAPACLAREIAGSKLVVLRLGRGDPDHHEHAARLEVSERLDSSVPPPAGSCPSCHAPFVSWDLSCLLCHADVAGPALEPDLPSTRERALAAVKEASQGAFEVLGEIRRAAGGAPVYFARDLAGGQIVALTLQHGAEHDPEPGPSLSVTRIRPAEGEDMPAASSGRRAEAGNLPATFSGRLEPGTSLPDGVSAGTHLEPSPALSKEVSAGEPGDLKLCPLCGEVFGAGQKFCPKDGSSLRAERHADDLVGRVIAGHLRILRKLGEGGMGTVYLAEHIQMGRQCAIKVMNPNLSHDPEALSRFTREAANASRINHANVADIYEFGEAPDDIVYLAMEFVEGEPLAGLLARERVLPVARAVEIGQQIADAFSVAHDLGIVHRDLKPDNIMLTRSRTSRDVVKVVDFGIAKATQSEGQTVTRTGLMVGTPAYMSPEQLRGAALDSRSDLYSLGCILYEMVTGQRPFAAPTGEVSWERRLTESPPKVRSIDPGLPGKLEEIISRAMARSPEERYQTAGELRDALVGVREAGSEEPRRSPGEPWGQATTVPDWGGDRVTTPPPTVAQAPEEARFSPWRLRRTQRMLVGAGGLVAALLTIAYLQLSRNGVGPTENNAGGGAGKPSEQNGAGDGVEPVGVGTGEVGPGEVRSGELQSGGVGSRGVGTDGADLAGVNGAAADALGAPPPAPAAPSNEPPNGRIEEPRGNVTIQQGRSVRFRGSGSAPEDGATAFSWSFVGGTPSSSSVKDPGKVSFPNVGTYTVTLEVTDGQGFADPTPDTRSITVIPPQSPADTRSDTVIPTQPTPSQVLKDIETKLHPDSLLKYGPREAEAALESVQALLPSLESGRDRAEAAIMQAEAYATLGQVQRACDILATPLTQAATENQRKRVQLYERQICAAGP